MKIDACVRGILGQDADDLTDESDDEDYEDAKWGAVKPIPDCLRTLVHKP